MIWREIKVFLLENCGHITWIAGNGVCIGPMLLELQNKQSMVLSGGYEDDEDHGEWFLYGGKYVLIIPS